MSVVQIGHVFTRSRSKGSARLVLLALADVASDDGDVTAYARSQSVLARKANVDANTVRRSIDSLVSAGEIEVITVGGGRQPANYRITLPESDPRRNEGASLPSRRRTPRKPSGQPRPDEGSITPSLPVDIPPSPQDATDGGEPSVAMRARAICKDVWERRDPKPATRYIAVVKIVERLLAAGWQDAAVTDAMMRVPTISIGWLEGELARRQPRQPDRVADQRRRAAPSGRLDMSV